MRSVIGIDIGGTFTDIVYCASDGSLVVDKVPSTPGRLHEGIRDALVVLGERHHVDVAEIETLVHGTTVATNALLEGTLPNTALVVTKGFGDILEIATMQRPSMYDLRADKPAPLVPRSMVIEVDERVDHAGNVVTPLTDDTLHALAAEIEGRRPDSVAVCLMFAFANPSHEERVARLVRGALADVSVSASHEVDPQFGELARANTTALNAALNPLLTDYIGRVQRLTNELMNDAQLAIMQSNGALMSPEMVSTNAHRLVLSGPAAGVMAACEMATPDRATNFITFDMGGTSSDLSLIAGGRPSIAAEPDPHELQPIRSASIAIHAVGAGGGSIANVDRSGVLTVGPQSAGSDPGPACYGRGGTLPTVTDAQLVLGRISPGGLLGGEMQLSLDDATVAIERHIARPLGCGVVEAADAIIEVAIASAARGLRFVSVNEGYDPRDFALVAYGGAGPIHACDLAVAAGMSTVIVPRASSAFSAFGLLFADYQQSWKDVVARTAENVTAASIEERLTALENEGRGSVMYRQRGESAWITSRRLNLRYVGQQASLRVEIDRLDDAGYADALERFRAIHQRKYGHSSETESIELVSLEVVASYDGPGRQLLQTGIRTTAAVQDPTERPVHFRGTGVVRCPVLHLDGVAGAPGVGPAIIGDRETTIVVPPEWTYHVDRQRSLILERS